MSCYSSTELDMSSFCNNYSDKYYLLFILQVKFLIKLLLLDAVTSFINSAVIKILYLESI